MADRMVDAYFKYRHPLNPYLHEGSFRQRYERLWLNEQMGGEDVSESNPAWLGLVNLVFAFGSDHLQQSGKAPIDRSRYFDRAKTLVLSDLLEEGSIELVQALLLLGQYLHGSLELNRCWIVIGLANRTAQGLGLHLDPSSFTSNVVEQEIRKRVWWGCFINDRVLSIKVGRLPTIHDGPDIKATFPMAVDDEYIVDGQNPTVQPEGLPSKLHFINQVIPLCRLFDRVLDTLYNGVMLPNTAEKPSQRSAEIAKLLAAAVQLDGELLSWDHALPPHLKSDSQIHDWHFERQRSILFMRQVGICTTH